MKSRLFVVRFMRCNWKIDKFLFKCVRCFNTDVTFCDFWNTKKWFTVTQEGNRVVKHSGRAYRQGTGTLQSHTSMTINAIGRRRVWFGQHFRRYRELMSLNFCMLILCYIYVVVYDFYTQIMLLQISGVTWILWFSVSLMLLQIICVMLLLCIYVYFML